MEKLLNKYAINQVAYIVDDLEEAALAHSRLFGSGPFIYLPAMTQKIVYQGQEMDLTMQQAYGQYGDVQIELIKVLSEPNPYFPEGKTGFHHFSVWTDDVEQAKADFEAEGYKPLFEMTSGGGLVVKYFDCTDTWGHCIECHAPIKGFWDSIAALAKDWDGSNPYRAYGS